MIDYNEKHKFIWLGLSSYSGYEREKFLYYISKNFKQDDFPFILLRTLDWVKKIRSFAINILISKLDTVKIETLKSNSKLIIAVLKKQNDEEKWVQFRQSILNTLIEEFLKDKSKYKNESPKYRRFIYFELINSNYPNLERIIRKDTDCFNRSLLFLPIFTNYVKKNITSLVKDKCVKLRMKVYDLFLSESPADFQNYFEASLLDNNSSILLKAFYYAKNYLNFEIMSYDTDHITNSSKLIICLSENPDKRDEYLFEQGIESTNKKVVKASLTALKKIGSIEKNKEKIRNIIFVHFRFILRPKIYKIYRDLTRSNARVITNF